MNAFLFFLRAIPAFFLVVQCLPGKAQDAIQILKRSDDVVYAPKAQHSATQITTIDHRGNERSMEAEFLQKGRDKRLVRFTAPASQAGIAFLSLPQDVMYLYLPAYKKERRIASHIKNQGFAGTDFSYADMEAKPMNEKYDPTLLSETSGSFILELHPKPGQGSDYSKLVITISKESYYTTHVEYYDQGGVKVKELVNTEIKKIDGYWMATEMVMTDLKQDHQTRMMTRSVTFDEGVTDDLFTVRNLVR